MRGTGLPTWLPRRPLLCTLWRCVPPWRPCRLAAGAAPRPLRCPAEPEYGEGHRAEGKEQAIREKSRGQGDSSEGVGATSRNRRKFRTRRPLPGASARLPVAPRSTSLPQSPRGAPAPPPPAPVDRHNVRMPPKEREPSGVHGAPGSDSGPRQHCAVLCCAVLCCAVLCCAVLCCGVTHPGVVACPALPLCRVPAGGAPGLSGVLPVELEPAGWQSGLRQAPSRSRAPALQEVRDAAVERLADLRRRPKEGARTSARPP